MTFTCHSLEVAANGRPYRLEPHYKCQETHRVRGCSLVPASLPPGMTLRACVYLLSYDQKPLCWGSSGPPSLAGIQTALCMWPQPQQLTKRYAQRRTTLTALRNGFWPRQSPRTRSFVIRRDQVPAKPLRRFVTESQQQQTVSGCAIDCRSECTGY